MLMTKNLAAFALLLSTSLLAQGVDPVGRVHPAAKPLSSVASFAVPALDRAVIQQDDQNRHLAGLPARFAMPNAVDVSPATHGTWEQLDKDWSLWRLRIQSPDASHVNLGITGFLLPAGARFMVYSADYACIVRPFDTTDNSASGELWTPVVTGEEIVAEVYIRTNLIPNLQLHLTQIGSGYRFFGAGGDAMGTDASGACNNDVVCPSAAPWVAEIPAIAAISSGGSVFCTGFMVNNTALDGRNFFMTAFHCGITSGVAPSLVCYWNYKNTTCAGPINGQLNQFNTGSTLRASYSTSDFTLVELNSTPNPAWGVTYAGWSNSSANATSAVGIHHPSGDPKKISFENQATATTSYGGTTSPGNGTHVRIIDWDSGTTEPGSSGSPLFDQNHHVIGQLHGGSAACGNNLSDYYGRFSMSWSGGGSSTTRLSNWLDPLGTGATTLDTLGNILATATSYGQGCYRSDASFVETFGANGLDLGGTATSSYVVALQPIANGYQVQPGTNAWFTPTSANLNLGDDALYTATLPFAFQFPGGSTGAAKMCSNGFLWLNGTSTDTSYTPAAADLCSGLARLAPLWLDLNPTAGGTCHYDVDPSGTAVYFTWNNVPAYNTGTTGNTFQLVLRQNQTVEFRYRLVPSTPAGCVVGWSRGATQVPDNKDISVAMPFPVTVDAAGLTFTPTNRPVLGTNQTINLGNITNPASSIGLTLVGFTQLAPGLNLSLIGAPDCYLHENYSAIQSYLVGGATHAWSLAIPGTPSLAGVHVYCQGALLQNGVNAFGVLTANAVDLKLDVQ